MNEPAAPLPEENPFANLGGDDVPDPRPPEEHPIAKVADALGSFSGNVAAEGAFEIVAASAEGVASAVGALGDGADAVGCLGEGCAGCFSISVLLLVLLLAGSVALAAGW